MNILYVGIDVGNRNCQVFSFTEAGEVIEAVLETNSSEQWPILFGNWSARFEVRACFEAGPHYEWMYDLLLTYCSEVVMVDPARFSLIGKSQKKTDKIDAQRLAEALRRGDLPAVHVPSKEVRSDRRLTHFMRWHSHQRSRLKGRIRSLLVTYRLRCPFQDVLGKKAQAWLAQYGAAGMDQQGALVLEMLLEEVRLVDSHHKALEAMLPERLSAYGEDAKILLSVPGFGPLVSLAVLSGISGIDRFASPGELSAYFGLCGRVYQSGDTHRVLGLTKRGNKTVRWLLSQAIMHLHRKDPKAKKRYQKLKRKKHRGVARAAQVRWLMTIVWQLLKKQERFKIGVPKRKIDKHRAA